MRITKNKEEVFFMKDTFEEMANRWPSAVVTRPEVHRFTGGIMRGSYLANLDGKGEGPPRERVGQKWAYPVKDFVAWLRERSRDNLNITREL